MPDRASASGWAGRAAGREGEAPAEPRFSARPGSAARPEPRPPESAILSPARAGGERFSAGQAKTLVHAIGHVAEPRLVAAADLGRRPPVVPHLGQRLEDFRPVLVALADRDVETP